LHNPEHEAHQLAAKLSPRGRHIVLLIGAGASCAAGLPDTAGLQVAVREALDEGDRAAYDRVHVGRDIEKALTHLRLVAETLRGTTAVLNDLTSDDATALDRKICSAIAHVIVNRTGTSTAHDDWARWAARVRQDEALEVFTTNYDLLLERALEVVGVPYFDGFVGTYEGRFRPDLVDSAAPPPGIFPPARWIRIWKLHGSISWLRLEGPPMSTVVRKGATPNPADGAPLAIFPSLQKYDESRRTPFVVLADRLRRSLTVPETLCLTIGYSFGDQHINEVLYEAATQHPSSEVVALFRGTAPAAVTTRAQNIPNLSVLDAKSATIGGQEGEWQAPSENTPFWKDGRFKLGDFAALARFLLLSVGRTEPERPQLDGQP